MNRIIKDLTIFIVVVMIGLLSGQTLRTTFKINYISANNVYVDGGTSDSLAVGDQLTVKRGNRLAGKIEVTYIAEHSASCKIISSSLEMKAGDVATVVKRSQRAVSKQSKPAGEPEKQPGEILSPKKPADNRSATRVDGNLSAMYYYFDDQTASNFDFKQPTFRFNLRARRLFGREYNLRIRTRARYDQRTRRYSSYVPRDQWRNRIYELSFSYDDDNAAFNYSLGRIISNRFSGVGYIDGALVQYNLSANYHFGIFGGTQPEWQYADFQTSIQKYGAYFNYTRGDYTGSRFESTTALAGEYHGSTVSREFLYFQNSIYGSQRWNVYQSAELDINRTWRKERAGNSISLTNLYLSGQYRITDWLTSGLSFDNRKNYQTYETRSIADSLFDDALRYGLRANLSVRFAGDYRLFINGGARKRKSDTRYTFSYAAGLNKMNFLARSVFLQFNGAGFSSFYTNGFSGNLRLGKYFSSGNSASIGYGNYIYTLSATSSTRTNQWIQSTFMFYIFNNIFLSGQYEYDWGSDVKGQRILGEIGYRF